MPIHHDLDDPIFSLSDAFVEAFANKCPLHASFAGIPGHDTRWNDFSPAGASDWAAVLTSFREKLEALPPSTNPWAALARHVMQEFLCDRLDDYAHQEHLLDLNSIDSTCQHLRMVFDVMATSSEVGWDAIVSRLETLDQACESYRASLEEGRKTGARVARRQAEAAIHQLRLNAGDKSFFFTLLTNYDATRSGQASMRARLSAGIEKACHAMAGFANYLESTYLPDARLVDAVGQERYLRLARRFLGMTIDPIETYAWGWSEVMAIEAELLRLAQQISPGSTLPEVVQLLKTDKDRCALNEEDFIRLMRERQLRALGELDGMHFDIPEPLRRIEVKVAPKGAALGAYYMPPSDGFTRAGTIWYALGDQNVFPLYDEITTAYHEGFPGHHLQCGLQVHLEDRLSRLHRLLVCYSGYAEGWALYAEQLMYELGYLDCADYILGMYVAKLIRAYRVVIDIGMHLDLAIPGNAPLHPGGKWTYEIGVEYLRQRGFLPMDHAESEITRYLGWPGQAISYKVGERVILNLRDELRRRQGSNFELKAFHAKVLGSGSVGLDHLRQLVLED